MSAPPPDTDARSPGRQLARLAVVAALVSCSLNCIVNQLAFRGIPALRGYGGLTSGISLAIVVLGIGLGIAGLIGGLRRRSTDTAVIAAIGLVLNLGIVFVVVWYFTLVRPELLPAGPSPASLHSNQFKSKSFTRAFFGFGGELSGCNPCMRGVVGRMGPQLMA
jgi:hypothetical protein